jgi:hypothetical protein
MEAICSSETIQRYKPEDRTVGEIKLSAKEPTAYRLYKCTNERRKIEHNQIKDGNAPSADERRSPR